MKHTSDCYGLLKLMCMIYIYLGMAMCISNIYRVDICDEAWLVNIRDVVYCIDI